MNGAFTWIGKASIGSLAGLLAMTIGLVIISGCGTGAAGNANEENSEAGAEQSGDQSAVVDDHSQWWCAPHGIPEEECSMCSRTAAAKFREEGDWCEEHDRAESQCFICDPSRAEKYAKLYRAKYGEDPPPIQK